MNATPFPWAFFWRRMHSFAGLGLVIFLMFHLMTNSQAALWIGNDGKGFIHSVNAINDIPYLEVVEFMFLALPLVIHALWGLYYLQTGKENAYGDSGNKPYLPEYERNKAYTWQRITSWILLFGVIAHVVHMRFVERPLITQEGSQIFYTVPLIEDAGLKALALRLNVEIKQTPEATKHVMAVAKDFGTAELLMVREAFKSPFIMGIYTIFILASCFHAFNGLWTGLITWGVPLSVPAQMFFLRVSTFLMFLFTLLGLATIYLTYWVNLR